MKKVNYTHGTRDSSDIDSSGEIWYRNMLSWIGSHDDLSQ
jgi:hypothetical protein